jgi:hypothetical protein
MVCRNEKITGCKKTDGDFFCSASREIPLTFCGEYDIVKEKIAAV